jgi:hypothetical protein
MGELIYLYDEKKIKLIKKAKIIIAKCRKYNYENIPEFIIRLSRRKVV